ncbi:uncharacterized protein LOC129913128 isoform X1 [Episyrphus balteatus]|uniref:uncharacterized protein LOC129913128 isoform X1 n=1 Tax=Episyrphus balteatus TaxID=286459 RepID=UPI0024865488|nr:uncharacterized protein LOC129913128 isoform X1 [Episyrphus balteatus]
MFKNHLEMIGRNETPSKKAKFWQSYIRSLKGSEDIRAHDTPKARSFRPYSAYVDSPSTYRSIFDEPATPSERIQSLGYRYQPVSRDTYGYSPRAIYDHHYSRTIPASYDAERAWNEHLKRMQEIEHRYPSRYGLYLKDKPTAPNALIPQEYEPEDKLLQQLNKARRSASPVPLYRAGSAPRSLSVPPLEPYVPPAYDRAASVAPRSYRASSIEPLPLRARSVDPYIPDLFSKFDRLSPFERAGSPTPVKPGRWGPRPTEIAYDSDGLPVFHPRNRFRDLFEPNVNAPISSFARDPFWWDIDDLAPYRGYPRSYTPPLVRDSFLSPVKNRYLWAKHPARPLLARYHY